MLESDSLKSSPRPQGDQIWPRHLTTFTEVQRQKAQPFLFSDAADCGSFTLTELLELSLSLIQ